MAPDRSSRRERMTLTKLGTLMENQGKEITLIAGGVVDLQKRVGRIELAVGELQRDVKDIKGWMNGFNQRLTAVEAKVS